MGEVIVIYDQDKEVAAIVDVDGRRGYGPALIGPDSATLLEGFVATVPYDITQVDSYTLVKWFEQYMGAMSGQGIPPTVAPDEGAVVEPGREGVAESRAAEREAIAESAAPPEAQPADTDMEGDAGETPLPVEAGEEPPQTEDDQQTPPPYEGVCWNCEGKQFVPGPDGQPVTCGVCKGTGRLPAPETTTA